MNSYIDRSRPLPTFDQLNVFLAVVDEQGFSAAAKRLNRRQSVISYMISALEGQLGGIALFDRTKRKPVLTEAGAAILVDARRMARVMDELCAKADGLRAGLEAELSVVLDVMVPSRIMVTVLADFRRNYPQIAVRLSTEVLGGVPASVIDGSSRLGISGPLFYAVDGLEKVQVGSTILVPVASTDHPLGRLAQPVSDREARKHIQVVLTDRSALSADREFAVLASETMRVSDLASKHNLILAGIGWGNLPEPMVRDDLAQGRLQRIPLAQWRARPYPLHAIHRIDAPPGPAARWLIERLRRALE